MSDSRTSWLDDPRQLEGCINTLKQEHAAARNLDKTLLRLYYQRPVTVTRDPMRPYAEISTFETLQQLGFGLTREVIDASLASVCQPLASKVEPQGTTPEIHTLCKQLSRFADAIMDVTEFRDVARRAYKDGEICTAGWVKWFIHEGTGELKCERVNPLNVYWHYDEGDEPTHLYTVESVPRHVLKERFPAKASEIEALPDYRVPSIVGVTPPGARSSDSVRVNEGWRASGKSGTHIVTAGTLKLDETPWPYDFHALVPAIWDTDHEGVGGVSLARVISPYHVWSNILVRQVFDSLMGAVPAILAHSESMLDQFSDVPWQKIFWDGIHKPEVYLPKTVAPEVLEQITLLSTRAYAEGGVNQHSAIGNRPAGLNSAPAQREWVDIKNARENQQQSTWERLWRRSAKVIVALAAVAYRNKTVRVKAPGTDQIEEMEFPKNLKEDQYKISFQLTSALSQTVSGKLEQLQSLHGMGIIDNRDVARSLGIVDIQSLSDRANAARDLAELQVSKCLEKGFEGFMMPSNLQGEDGLAELVKIGSQEWQRATLSPNRYPPENVEALRRLIKAAQARQKPPAPPAGPTAPTPIPVTVVPSAAQGAPPAAAPPAQAAA